ncbi:MAG TPA: hypothetical protein VMR70_08725 [Flavisolibacter sp.]|nr:hypothetical protein [Flavisolibacter sp.]
MIDSREVRPGNWVIKVTGIDTNTKPFYEYKAVLVDEYFYSFVKFCFPILLTTGVLGSSGFRHEFGDWFKNEDAEGIDDGLPFLCFRHSDKCWYFRNSKIPAQPIYLHQLQNLVFALTNQELAIKLGFFENLPMVGPINFFVKAAQKNTTTKQLL